MQLFFLFLLILLFNNIIIFTTSSKTVLNDDKKIQSDVKRYNSQSRRKISQAKLSNDMGPFTFSSITSKNTNI